MIRYSLICAAGHEFESWFSSSKACDAQIKRKLVACPICDSTKVEKAIMAPSLIPSTRKHDQAPDAGRHGLTREHGLEALLTSLRMRRHAYPYRHILEHQEAESRLCGLLDSAGAGHALVGHAGL